MTERSQQLGHHAKHMLRLCVALTIGSVVHAQTLERELAETTVGNSPAESKSPNANHDGGSTSPVTVSPAELAPTITSAIDRDRLEVAEPFTWTLTVNAPQGTDVQFPPPTAAIGPFEVIDSIDRFDVPEQLGRSWTRTFVLESFESGTLELPAFPIMAGNIMLRSEPITVEVQSALQGESDPTQFRGMKEVVELPDITPDSRLGRWVTAALAVVAATVCILVFVRRKKPISPDAWANQRLDVLRQTVSSTKDDNTTVVPAITDILRQYIERRFQISAPQQTTAEFLSSILHDSRLDERQQRGLQQLLCKADAIKFAAATDGTAIDATFSQARTFITETTLQHAARKRTERAADQKNKEKTS